jgi:pilus assembly protein Flp/PilA
MKSVFKRFASDESGATAIEYGLIAALIAVVVIATLTTLGSRLNAKFAAISGNLQ